MRPYPRFLVTRLALPLVVSVSLCPSPVHARSQTKAELDAAARRMRTLQSNITKKEAAATALRKRLEDLAAQVDRKRADAAVVQRKLKETKVRLAATEREHGALKDRLGGRVRAIHMRGPASLLDFVLGAGSMSDLIGRVTFAARVVRHDTDLALGVSRKAAELDGQRAAETRLLAEKAELYKAAVRQQDAIEATFVRQQRELAGLARARAELGRLVQQLQDKLRAEELALARRVAGAGMPITFGQWAQAFLATLGAPASRPNLVAVVAWETAEYTSATWNPLATTYAMPGATVYNSHGVRNYVSKEQGIDATIRTLRLPNHGYEAIVSSVKQGADAMTTGEAINASDWCRGCTSGNYVIGLIPAVEAYYEKYAG